MAFNGNLEHLGPQGAYGVDQWTYDSDSDSAGTVMSSGYFNNVAAKLQKNDLIYITGNNDITVLCKVTSNSYATPVTLATYNRGNTGSYGSPSNYLVQAMAGGATANNEIEALVKMRIIDCKVILKAAGSASDTLKLQTEGGTNDISNAMDISGADKSVVRVGTLDDAHATIDAGDKIRVLETDGGGNDSPACDVYIEYIEVA